MAGPNDVPNVPRDWADDPFVTDLNLIATQLGDLLRTANQLLFTIQDLLKLLGRG